MGVTFTPAGDDDRALDLACRNATDLLTLLGYHYSDGDLYGEAAPADLLQRITAARAVIQATGKRTTSGNVTTLRPVDPALPAVSNGRFHEGGRPAGYLAQRLDDLSALAALAAARGGTVSWG